MWHCTGEFKVHFISLSFWMNCLLYFRVEYLYIRCGAMLAHSWIKEREILCDFDDYFNKININNKIVKLFQLSIRIVTFNVQQNDRKISLKIQSTVQSRHHHRCNWIQLERIITSITLCWALHSDDVKNN